MKKKTTTSKKKSRKAATPSAIAKAQQDRKDDVQTASGVRDSARTAQQCAHSDPELTASEIATQEAKNAGLRIFEVTNNQDDDTLYFAALDQADAKDELFIHCGKIPDELIEIKETDALPEDAIFANDVAEKRDQSKAAAAAAAAAPLPADVVQDAARQHPAQEGSPLEDDDSDAAINPLGGGN